MILNKITLIPALALAGALAGCGPVPIPKGDDALKIARDAKLPIYISDLKTKIPLMSGNIDIGIDYVNTSGKTIRSVRFYLIAKDAQGNSVPDMRTNRFTAKLDDLEQVEPDGKGSGHWNAVWENRRIVCSLIKQTDVEYVDGTVISGYVGLRRSDCR